MSQTDSRLRVLHVLPTLTGGGAENFVCALVPNFDRRRVDAGIMAIYPTDVPASVDRPDIPIIKIGRRGRYDSAFFGRMVRTMRQFKPHVVHTHLHNGKYWGRLAALTAHVPVVVFTEHNPCAERRILPEIAFDLVVNRLTDGIATFAEPQKARLTRLERLPPGKIVVLDNGIALPPKPHPELRKRARQRLSLHGGEIAILVVARLIERKNQQLAIRALATIDGETRSRLRLIIVGEGEDYAMLRSLADASGFTDRITLTGNRDDAVELLYGGDVFYMPSLAEGMPLAMIEAMSVALPVISTPWTGVAALLGDAELGTIVPDWSAEASADAILQFIKEPAAFTERAMRAMRSVREKHDIARVAREHEEWYRRLARARGVA